ncbi:unnamed protein product [Pichia kudriavzevii]
MSSLANYSHLRGLLKSTSTRRLLMCGIPVGNAVDTFQRRQQVPRAYASTLLHLRTYTTKKGGPAKKRESLYTRLKYFLLRQNRPFNIDEVSAFFSWILMGNVLWILVGTTTFAGVLIYVVNWIGDGEIERMVLRKLITFDNNLKVDLSDKNFRVLWQDGKIKIRNLKVSNEKQGIPKHHSEYRLEISEVNLTLSLRQWLDGTGLIDGIEIDGLHGNMDIVEGDQLILDNSFHDNYELSYLKIKHSQIRFNSEYFNKPLELVIFNCDLKKFRRKWMVYDFLNANSVFGSLGGSLFTLHKRQHRFAHFQGMDTHQHSDDSNNVEIYKNQTVLKNNDYNFNNNDNDDNNDNGNTSEDLWKKMTRIRIDMLDLSYLNNDNSKLNWINSGKAELIFDIMLPNEDDDDEIDKLKDDLNFEFSVDGFKKTCETVWRKLNDDDTNEPKPSIEKNKYVVIDLKINYFDLSARFPQTIPCSSVTGKPYISSQQLQSLVTFINDEKFGLSSKNMSRINNIDNEDDQDEDNLTTITLNNTPDSTERDEDFEDTDFEDQDHIRHVLPPIKFRLIQNLNDFEYVDLPSLLTFTSRGKPEEGSDEKIVKSFINTNKFIDNSMNEVFSLLLLYEEEIQTKLINMYSRRSGFEILFNNFILGNLILVGLGSFVI